MQSDLFDPTPQPLPPTTAAPGVTLYLQDAHSLRTVAACIRQHLARPGLVMDGGRAFTLPGLLAQAAEWTGRTYTRAEASHAAADMDALALVADAGPAMTMRDHLARGRRR